MPIVTAPISQLTNGTVATNGALTALDISTVGENATVTTLGAQAVGDGMGGTFYLAAASTRTVESGNVLNTSSTGRWIKVGAFSGVGPTTVSLTGYNETFALLSGFFPVVYTLPISSNVVGKVVTVKAITTGTVTIRCGNATDLIVDNGPSTSVINGGFVAPVASITSTLSGGQAFNFIAPTAGRYYRIDKVGGAI